MNFSQRGMTEKTLKIERIFSGIKTLQMSHSHFSQPNVANLINELILQNCNYLRMKKTR